jgi:hypothetical protein
MRLARTTLLAGCLAVVAAPGCRAVLDLEPGVLVTGDTGDGGVGDAKDSGVDAPPTNGRRLAYVQASPDSPPLVPCAAIFPSMSVLDGGGDADLIQPFEPASGLTFGGTAVVPVNGDLDAALGGPRAVMFYFAPADSGCKNAIGLARGDNKRRVVANPGRVKPGMTEAIVAMGCIKPGPGSNGECGMGTGISFDVRGYDVPSADPGPGRVHVQFLNASPFVNTGSGPPSFTNLDAYLQAFKGTSTVGGPVTISVEGTGYQALKPLPPAVVDPAPAGAVHSLAVTAHGQPVCPSSPGTPPTCSTVTLPLIVPTNDPSASLDVGHHVLLVLTGSPLGSPPNLKGIMVGMR